MTSSTSERPRTFGTRPSGAFSMESLDEIRLADACEKKAVCRRNVIGASIGLKPAWSSMSARLLFHESDPAVPLNPSADEVVADNTRAERVIEIGV